ncbi:hypothetical protein ACFUYE_21335, partial [Micromonospora humida]|uniref:hypothetical protein n=1 Tax=Micromonospora humida TaxID=2809018 RepID=UPI00366D373E
RAQDLHRARNHHRAPRDAARDEVMRRGRTEPDYPLVVGTTNGEPVRLIYDVEVYRDVVA